MADQQFVIFRLHQEEFGLTIQQVNEIVLMQEITKYPQAGDFIEGIINLRDKIIPIIDLKKRFYGLPSVPGETTRIIVINCGGQVLGIIVDEVLEVIHLKESMIEPPPTFVQQGSTGVKGVGKLERRLIILLDLTEAFSSVEVSQLQSAAS